MLILILILFVDEEVLENRLQHLSLLSKLLLLPLELSLNTIDPFIV